ncbi:hypothetical protein [Stygiolobus azoricus]|nr:hypothetical protein [Stygiolobus azoricus]
MGHLIGIKEAPQLGQNLAAAGIIAPQFQHFCVFCCVCEYWLLCWYCD